MLDIHIIQAEYGDCFIIQCGNKAAPTFVLIDGGPKDVYDDNLKSELIKYNDAGKELALAIVSHIDYDHITGILKLVMDNENQKINEKDAIIEIKELWFNSYYKTIGSNTEVSTKFSRFQNVLKSLSNTMLNADCILQGFAQGNMLKLKADQIDIQIFNNIF